MPLAAMAVLAGCNPNKSFQHAEAPQVVQPLATRPVAPEAPPVAGACSDEVIEEILTPASINPAPVFLTCQAVLPAKSSVTRQIIFEGSAASGGSLDCNGGRLESTSTTGDREAIVIRSRKMGDGWDRPIGVAVQNCEIANGLRIYGLGRSGEAQAVKQSSLNADHNGFAQASAPSGVTLNNLRFANAGGIPLYISPGVTHVTLTNSQFTGTSSSVAIYLDAESGGAVIAGNIFDLRTDKRELIAIDGSAYNAITGNLFNTASNGGIYLYRNCGEGGTIRHQAPQFNRIEGNSFAMHGSRKPAVWLNSRKGDRPYCFSDPTHPFGSSITPLDMAQHNTVSGNAVSDGAGKAFRNDDPSNQLSNNGE